MEQQPRSIQITNRRRPPRVIIGGASYQFDSMLELRFAVLLHRLGWPICYHPLKFQFTGYRNKPWVWTPDFVVPAGQADHKNTTIYECMGKPDAVYVRRAIRYKRLNPTHDIVMVMHNGLGPKQQARYPARQKRIEQAVTSGHWHHVWYVGADFRKLGIVAEAQRLCLPQDNH